MPNEKPTPMSARNRMMKSEGVNPDRRQFLDTAKGVGLLGAALALLGRSAVTDAVPAPAIKQASDAARAGGYHETEHIRKYYASARYF